MKKYNYIIMNITKRFNKILHTNNNLHVIGYKENKLWKWDTRTDLKNKILTCIDILRDRNIKPKDRIMYKGKNSIEWVSWNIATNAVGGIWVPLYHNQNDEYVNHIINDCNPTLFITNDLHYKNVNIINNKIYPTNYNSEIPFNNDNEIANLIYTSGTTGKPKGVILSHENILANINSIEDRFSDFQNSKQYTTLNILPWAHIYGLTAELYYNLLNNNKVAICSGPDNLINEIREINPDLLYFVPRILQLIKSKLEKFDKPVINKLLPYIIKYIFGKNLLTIFIGGAQLDESTKNFYINNNINICEGYGCTETSPLISVNHINCPRDIHSVGKIMDNLLIKIVNNEICVSGPSVMKGYWQNEEATNDVLVKFDNNENIYYKTGDEGYLENGFLYYTGRTKENYKLTNGKFVNVNETENIIKKYTSKPFMVYGNNELYNIIIVENDSDINDNNLDRINNELHSYVKINKILKVKNGTFDKFYTPKMSLKRNEIEKYLIEDIKKIYA